MKLVSRLADPLETNVFDMLHKLQGTPFKTSKWWSRFSSLYPSERNKHIYNILCKTEPSCATRLQYRSDKQHLYYAVQPWWPKWESKGGPHYGDVLQSFLGTATLKSYMLNFGWTVAILQISSIEIATIYVNLYCSSWNHFTIQFLTWFCIDAIHESMKEWETTMDIKLTDGRIFLIWFFLHALLLHFHLFYSSSI